MTLYYENADLLKEMVHEDESWGFCYLNIRDMPSFIIGSAYIYPLFKEEMRSVINTYDPDYIMLTTDFIEFYDEARALAEELETDFLFWDFKDTIFGISPMTEVTSPIILQSKQCNLLIFRLFFTMLYHRKH